MCRGCARTQSSLHVQGWPHGHRRTSSRVLFPLALAAVETVLSVLQVLISVVLVLLVLMHSGKDSGLSGAFGVGSGTGPLGGGSMVERNLHRGTGVLPGLV